MIRACRNLQLQIVWNWFGVLGLFGRPTAIGSIYLLTTTKVSGNTKRGNRMGILLFFCFFLTSDLCWGLENRKTYQTVWGISFLFLAALWRWTEHVYFWHTPKFQVISRLPRSPWYHSVDSNELVFNEDIFTAFGHDGSTYFAHILPTAWDTRIDENLSWLS